MGSKNNPKNRGENLNKKIYKDKEVEPVMFVGENKKYLSAKYLKSNDIILDEDKKPIRWKDI